jgi:prepilin-type N-terminal cleavage/methylation domain-containing protein
MRSISKRAGFTLVELLVVIAIIAILIALLVSAVQRVREAANITKCKNQLKQIGLAFQSHHDHFKVFPSGGGTYADSSTGRKKKGDGVPEDYNSQSWGWPYQILPYIERQDLWAEKSDSAIAETPVPTYICPSFRGAIIRPIAFPSDMKMRAMADYTANGGLYGTWADLTVSSNSFDGAIVPSKNYSKTTRKLGDITDGTSSTLLIGEKNVVANGAYDPLWGWENWGGGPCNDNEGWVDGWDNDVICFANGRNFAAGPVVLPTRIGFTSDLWEDTCGLNFGSIHESMMAVFCDGSVHAIAFDINPKTWEYLCRINDRQPTGFEEQ